jgi:hypothetical protein
MELRWHPIAGDCCLQQHWVILGGLQLQAHQPCSQQATVVIFLCCQPPSFFCPLLPPIGTIRGLGDNNRLFSGACSAGAPSLLERRAVALLPSATPASLAVPTPATAPAPVVDPALPAPPTPLSWPEPVTPRRRKCHRSSVSMSSYPPHFLDRSQWGAIPLAVDEPGVDRWPIPRWWRPTQLPVEVERLRLDIVVWASLPPGGVAPTTGVGVPR